MPSIQHHYQNIIFHYNINIYEIFFLYSFEINELKVYICRHTIFNIDYSLFCLDRPTTVMLVSGSQEAGFLLDD